MPNGNYKNCQGYIDLYRRVEALEGDIKEGRQIFKDFLERDFAELKHMVWKLYILGFGLLIGLATTSIMLAINVSIGATM